MTEIALIMFLLVGFMVARGVYSRYPLVYLLLSVVVPLVMLVTVVYIFSDGSAYHAGQVTGQCFIPAVATVIMMILVFFLKKKKSTN